MKILVADDDKTSRILLKAVLQLWRNSVFRESIGRAFIFSHRALLMGYW